MLASLQLQQTHWWITYLRFNETATCYHRETLSKGQFRQRSLAKTRPGGFFFLQKELHLWRAFSQNVVYVLQFRKQVWSRQTSDASLAALLLSLPPPLRSRKHTCSRIQRKMLRTDRRLSHRGVRSHSRKTRNSMKQLSDFVCVGFLPDLGSQATKKGSQKPGGGGKSSSGACDTYPQAPVFILINVYMGVILAMWTNGRS